MTSHSDALTDAASGCASPPSAVRSSVRVAQADSFEHLGADKSTENGAPQRRSAVPFPPSVPLDLLPAAGADDFGTLLPSDDDGDATEIAGNEGAWQFQWPDGVSEMSDWDDENDVLEPEPS